MAAAFVLPPMPKRPLLPQAERAVRAAKVNRAFDVRDTIFKTRSPKGFLFQKYVANRAQGHKAFAQNKGRSRSDTPKKKERPRRTALT